MRHLTFQVKLPALGKPAAELLGPKLASQKGYAGAFGRLVHGEEGEGPPALAPHLSSGRRAPHGGGDEGADEHRGGHREDPTDPRVRQAAHLGPPPGLLQNEAAGPSAPPPTVEVRARSSLEDLLPALVRRVAWTGDGRRGTVRLELGSGSLAGAELVVHAEDGRVRVQLHGPAGVDLGPLRERIAARLARRGLSLEDVE